MDIMMEYLAKGFVVMLMVALPCVLVAAGIGLVVGILQAVTQVQEQTIAAAPKILFVFLTIIILGAWYVKILSDFFVEGVSLAFNVIPKNDSYVLPSDYYKYTKPFIKEFYKGENKTSGKFSSGVPQKAVITKDSPRDLKTGTYSSKGPDFMERMKIKGK